MIIAIKFIKRNNLIIALYATIIYVIVVINCLMEKTFHCLMIVLTVNVISNHFLEDQKRPGNIIRKKPVIYLYPEKEKDISVQLDFDFKKIKFIAIYP